MVRDQILIDAGERGELLVAQIRLALSLALLLIPVVGLFFELLPGERAMGFATAAIGVLVSLLVYVGVRQGRGWPYLGIVTACVDVTLVSGALAAYLLADQPHTAVNSRVTFEAYFIAIGATCLRYDRRACLAAGLLAVAEHMAIAWVASTYWALNETELYAPFLYGAFSWSSQVSRSMMLLVATALSFVVVMRTQALVRLSTRDALTGLFNRGYFQERMVSEVSRVARSGRLLTIAVVDVDHFKTFNDAHGHAAGDQVLKSIAATLQRSFRLSDIVCRWGGEEFVIAMPDTDVTAAQRRLEGVRQALAEESGVTFSAGLAAFPVDATSIEKVIGVADARLFQAKGAGRNRIVVAGIALLVAIAGLSRPAAAQTSTGWTQPYAEAPEYHEIVGYLFGERAAVRENPRFARLTQPSVIAFGNFKAKAGDTIASYAMLSYKPDINNLPDLEKPGMVLKDVTEVRLVRSGNTQVVLMVRRGTLSRQHQDCIDNRLPRFLYLLDARMRAVRACDRAVFWSSWMRERPSALAGRLSVDGATTLTYTYDPRVDEVTIALDGARAPMTTSAGWTLPYPAAPEYFERAGDIAGMQSLTAFGMFRRSAPLGETAASYATLVQNLDLVARPELIDRDIAISSLTEVRFEADGATALTALVRTGTPSRAHQQCLDAQSPQLWHLPDERWQDVAACDAQVTWSGWRRQGGLPPSGTFTVDAATNVEYSYGQQAGEVRVTPASSTPWR